MSLKCYNINDFSEYFKLKFVKKFKNSVLIYFYRDIINFELVLLSISIIIQNWLVSVYMLKPLFLLINYESIFSPNTVIEKS